MHEGTGVPVCPRTNIQDPPSITHDPSSRCTVADTWRSTTTSVNISMPLTVYMQCIFGTQQPTSSTMKSTYDLSTSLPPVISLLATKRLRYLVPICRLSGY